MYYTEADNVLLMPRPERTRRAMEEFMHANGTHSYMAPQRLERKRRDMSLRARYTDMDSMQDLIVVGQNQCQDERGDVVSL